MRDFRIIRSLIIILLVAHGTGYASPIIDLSLVPYPSDTSTATPENNVNAALVAGIYGTYGGFIEISDKDGKMNFMRKHPKPQFTLYVTTEAEPVWMIYQTIHHWILQKNEPVIAYNYSLEEDADNNLSYWNVTAATVALDRIIPLESIILFADPASVYIPEGITVSPKSAHLILPPIYIKPGFAYSERAFKTLAQIHLYQPVTYASPNDKAPSAAPGTESMPTGDSFGEPSTAPSSAPAVPKTKKIVAIKP